MRALVAWKAFCLKWNGQRSLWRFLVAVNKVLKKFRKCFWSNVSKYNTTVILWFVLTILDVPCRITFTKDHLKYYCEPDFYWLTKHIYRAFLVSRNCSTNVWSTNFSLDVQYKRFNKVIYIFVQNREFTH